MSFALHLIESRQILYMIYQFVRSIVFGHHLQVLNPSTNKVFFLLTKDDSCVLDALARNLYQITVVCTKHPTHLSCALQLHQIAFAEAKQVTYRFDIYTDSR